MVTEKFCAGCQHTLPSSAFYAASKHKDGLSTYCKTCNKQKVKEWYQANKERHSLYGERYVERNREKIRAYQKEYQAKNRERLNAQHRKRHAARTEKVRARDLKRDQQILATLKEQVFQILGRECYCCKKSDVRFLTIDHIQNDGQSDRTKYGFWMNSRSFLQHVLAEGCPTDRYRVACCNCNMAREKAGSGVVCPHHPDFEAIRLDMDKGRTKAYWSRKRADQKIKSKVYELLGQVCFCCGESNANFLTIDHINSDGYVDRKRKGYKMSVYSFCKHILSQPDAHLRYRVACYDCNSGRAFRGHHFDCPHQIASAA